MFTIEKWIERKQNEKKGLFALVLFISSKFYEFGVFCRHILYKLNVFSSHKVELPVISIGNIVCGGCGKTELVSKILQDANSEHLAVLSRGYRGKNSSKKPQVVKDLSLGDEPFMLASRFKKNLVIVGKKREESARFAKELGAKGVILDDGMQYLRLKKDLNIVCVRAENFDGKGFLPYGKRRELMQKLSCADFVMIHGTNDREKYELVKRSVLCYSRSNCFGTHYFLELNKEFTKQKVSVFCGLGNPQLFLDELRNRGIEIVHQKILADHEKMSDLKEFIKASKEKGAEKVLCTEKDYIKLLNEEKTLVEPVSLDMQVVFEQNNYNIMINTITNLIETKI